MHAVIETPTYLRQAKAAGLTESERLRIVSYLADNPTAGELIPGTGGLRKVRFPGRGKGKSGGYRTIHYYAATDIPIFLFGLVDKGQRANISKAERNELSNIVGGLADEYREGIKTKLGKIS